MERDGFKCVYCGYDATCVDHVMPRSCGGANHPSNLVASCDPCNQIASDKVFDSLMDKTSFIRSKYGKGMDRRHRIERKKMSVCIDCHTPFSIADPESTIFLCGHCSASDRAGERGNLI